jgi:hypothetical protein
MSAPEIVVTGLTGRDNLSTLTWSVQCPEDNSPALRPHAQGLRKRLLIKERGCAADSWGRH